MVKALIRPSLSTAVRLVTDCSRAWLAASRFSVRLSCRRTGRPLIAEAMAMHAAGIGYIPMHQRPVIWAMRRAVHVPVMPDDSVRLAWVHVDP